MRSKRISLMAITAGGQGWAGTVLNKSHCDCGPKSGRIGFLFLSCYCFVARQLDAKGNSVPSDKKNESPGTSPGIPVFISTWDKSEICPKKFGNFLSVHISNRAHTLILSLVLRAQREQG